MAILDFLNTKVNDLPIFVYILIFTLLFTQSTWLFIDSRKRKANHWFWGIIGLLRFPEPLIFYVFLVRKIHKRKKES